RRTTYSGVSFTDKLDTVSVTWFQTSAPPSPTNGEVERRPARGETRRRARTDTPAAHPGSRRPGDRAGRPPTAGVEVGAATTASIQGHAMTRLWDGSIQTLARAAGRLSRAFRLGAGTSVPGFLVERLNPGYIARRAAALDAVVVVSGTNGKTTTVAMIETILA